MPVGATALVLGFPEVSAAARRLAETAGLTYAEIELHRFPDGETRVRLPPELPADVILYRTLDRPNDKLVELILAAETARTLGADRLTLVAPYLCYMRQDMAFHPGEAISQRIIGDLLAGYFEALLTVDPHLHRVHKLSEAVPTRHSLTLTAASAMGAFLATRLERPLLLGPDEESRQWVARVARDQGFDFLVGRKERSGDREVRVRLPEADYTGREVVLLDDVASSGCTLETAALALAPQRPASLSVLVTHALFAPGAMERLQRAGVHRVWSTDSIAHPSNRIHLASVLAEGLARILPKFDE